METRITKLLGSKYPMIQGGMAWIAESTLASAVSNAGAVGLIAGMVHDVKPCKEVIDEMWAEAYRLLGKN